MLKTILVAALLALAGCQSSTDFGPCVGVTDDKNPGLTYKVSGRNLVLGILFFETAVVPAYIVIEEFECPIARKAN